MITRKSSRLIIVNEKDELLLFSYCDEHSGQFWATVGGELKKGETYSEAATRELFEETGLVSPVGRVLRDRIAVYAVARSQPAQWLEKYFLVYWPPGQQVSADSWTEEEQSTIQEWKWWSLEALRSADSKSFKPEWLPNLLGQIVES